MNWLGLDPQSIADRAKAGGGLKPPPGLFASVALGSIGFMFVSVAGFAPWALAGRTIQDAIGEAGLYVVCAVVFIGLSGAVLHPLIVGPGSLWRFYALFAVAFSAYAFCWIVGWMSLRGHLGSVTGLLLGTSVMGWVLVRAFNARSELWKVVVALFFLNAIGYFIGGWVEGGVAAMSRFLGLTITRQERTTVAMLLWGVCYGLGLGAGLGLAFYYCQARARALLLGCRGMR